MCGGMDMDQSGRVWALRWVWVFGGGCGMGYGCCGMGVVWSMDVGVWVLK